MKKVLFMSELYEYNAANDYILDVFLAEGYEVTLVSYNQYLYKLDIKKVKENYKNILGSKYKSIKVISFENIEKNYDIFFIHSYIVWRKYERKFVDNINAKNKILWNHLSDYGFNEFYKNSYAKVYNKFNYIIDCTAKDKLYNASEFKNRSEKTTIINNTLKFFELSKINKTSNKEYFYSSSTRWYQKGIPELIIMYDSLGTNIEYYITGQDLLKELRLLNSIKISVYILLSKFNFAFALKQIINSQKALKIIKRNKNIKIKGFISYEDQLSNIKNSLCVLQNSYADANSTFLLETISCKKIAFARRRSSFPEFEGLVVPHNNIKELRENIFKFINKKEKHNEILNNIKMFSLKKYNLKNKNDFTKFIKSIN